MDVSVKSDKGDNDGPLAKMNGPLAIVAAESPELKNEQGDDGFV